jgi:glycosyltransferase involved in cell wall biosynthesis
VVVTSYCGISEWINNDVGRVVDYKEEQLGHALIDILENPKRDEMAYNARQMVLETFDWDKVVKRNMVVYQECIEDYK